MIQKKHILSILAVLFLPLFAVAQTGVLPRSQAWEQNVDPQALLEFVKAVTETKDTELHHLMVVRGGAVLAEIHPEPFRAEDRHTLYSASKTFTALAAGLAYDDNLLRINDRVASFFPEFLPDSVSEKLAEMTVKDLLTMSSGIVPDWEMRSNTTKWIQTWLAKKVIDPGKQLRYDSMTTYMLSAVVQKVTGKTIMDLLRERIFTPMGISEVAWEESPEGINTGGWGLHIQTESEAKIGMLLCHKGEWEGKQLVSREWIEQMTSKQIPTGNPNDPPADNNQGYGYQTWMSMYPGAFCANGAFGQYIAMVPQKDVVVVISERSGQGAQQLKHIWNILMPGVKDEPVEPDEAAEKAIADFCNKQKLPVDKGKKSVMMSKPVEKTMGAFTIKLQGAPTMTIEPRGGVYQLTWALKEGPMKSVPLAFDQWSYRTNSDQPPYSITPRGRFTGLGRQWTTAGRYCWTNGQTLKMQVQWVNWISARYITVDFKEMKVTVRDNFTGKTIAYNIQSYQGS